MDKKKAINLLKMILKIAFTVLLVVLIFRKIDVTSVKKLLLTSNVEFIILAIFAYFISQLLSSWRLLSFLKSIGLNLSYGYNFRLYMLGLFYNVFLPGGVGGDGYKVYILRKRYHKPTKQLIISMLLDRVSGLWAIGAICAALMIMIPKIEIPQYIPIGALIVGTAVYYLLLAKFFPNHVKHFTKAHIKAIGVQSFQVLAVICILMSHNFTGKFSPYLFSFLVSSLGVILPTLGGAGVREYFMTHATNIFALDGNLAVFLAFTFYIVSTLVALPGIWFVYRSKEFGPMPNEAEIKQVEDDV